MIARAVALGLSLTGMFHAEDRRMARAARSARLERIVRQFEPYTGMIGGAGWPTRWGRSAIPVCITNAESHGLVHEATHASWGGPSGRYQIIPSTWLANGGGRFAPAAYLATEVQQSIVASRIWNHGRGARAWSTAAGCGY
jgi:hypothetical protein